MCYNLSYPLGDCAMTRHVVVSNIKGHPYVRVCESYRNAQGKPRSRTIENHGRLDICKKDAPDFLEKLRARVAQENEAARKAKGQLIENAAQGRIRRLEAVASPENTEGAKVLNIGVALLRQIWKEDLRLTELFRYLQSKTSIEYSYDKAAFLLSAHRILDPSSKKKTFESRKSNIIPCDIEDINVVYRVLDRLCEDKQAIVRHINRQINKKLNRSITVAFYDVTTYAFESRQPGELLEFGLSKDNKVNEVQVVLGLVMDDNGIPIDYDVFPGNTSEFGTMLPMIKRIKEAYAIETLIVVADRGLNSNENLAGLRDLGCDFVLAQKVRNCTAEQKKSILNDGNWEDTVLGDDGEVLTRYKTIEQKKTLFETKIHPVTGKKVRSSKKIGELDVQWIVSYSNSRATKDNTELDRAIDKAEKAIQNNSALKSSRGYKALIKTPKGRGKPELNEEKISDARTWAGYYAVCTNLTCKTSQEIMRIYRNLWRIEDCFRVSKTALETRPCFVWTTAHVKGHFLSCFISLVIEKYMHHVLKEKLGNITTNEINTALRTACLAYDDANPQMPLYLRLNVTSSRFDEMLNVFNLKAPGYYETAATLRKKLRLKSIYPTAC